MGWQGKQQEGKRLLTLCFLFIDQGRTAALGLRDEMNMTESPTFTGNLRPWANTSWPAQGVRAALELEEIRYNP